jgi:hypothetical protein
VVPDGLIFPFIIEPSKYYVVWPDSMREFTVPALLAAVVGALSRSNSQLAKQLPTAYALSDVPVYALHAAVIFILAEISSGLSAPQDFDPEFQVLGPCFVISVQSRKFFDSELCKVLRP